VTDSASLVRLLQDVNEWSLHSLTVMNHGILTTGADPGAVKAALATGVLTRLPAAEAFSPQQAQQLVVLLGLAGASVGRHYQEADLVHRDSPQQAFSALTATAAGIPFLQYFEQLAERTGTGHCARDSFASLVRWNVPAVEVEYGGRLVARLDTVFTDGLVRTYTGAVDEQRFFGLLKASEVVERAVNAELVPLSDGSVGLDEAEALTRIMRAVALLNALRELNHDFADRPTGQGLQVTHFMDVFRQFAVHWEPGDIPPSGALDVEALIRDLVVGIDLPGYPDHIRRVSPGLLGDERATLDRLLNRPSLPLAALKMAQCAPDAVAGTSASDLHRLVTRHPVLAALYLLLNAHARVAGVHLRLTKIFLFDPQRARDLAGIGDVGVVSNRSGTTGMDEARLDMFTRVRRQHILAPLRVLGARTLEAAARPATDSPDTAMSRAVLVRFTGTELDPYDLGLPARPN
jgi:hypothetical protein